MCLVDADAITGPWSCVSPSSELVNPCKSVFRRISGIVSRALNQLVNESLSGSSSMRQMKGCSMKRRRVPTGSAKPLDDVRSSYPLSFNTLSISSSSHPDSFLYNPKRSIFGYMITLLETSCMALVGS
jgi:hypothetical protein